jgi:uncharacterized protein YyaL (SSP411 family)
LRLLLVLLVAVSWPLEAANRLAGSTSRYLRQHADNPVDWYPWGEEAFAKAKRENKPLFISIGYSTCHWCHVMERESFADPATAKLMNETFVAVKVDREERPDLDSVYLAAARTLTGDAGWPNNVIVTPDGRPFFAVSYVPNAKFVALVSRIGAMWRERREQVESSAAMVTASLQSVASAAAEGSVEAIVPPLAERGYRQLAARFDEAHGGFLPEPKFPAPHQLMFLLRWWYRSGDARALAMVEKTLLGMRAGAIRDARGLGFHRYSGNADWSDPHYEKMLYDQALLAMACLEAYQATGKKVYAGTAREVFTYVLRELKADGGAFAAGQDADERYYTADDRSKLPKPGRDGKVLADWNGLMIAALARGAIVLDDASLAAAAAKAAHAVDGLRRPFLDDQAFFVWGLLDLYEATFELRWLDRAIAIHAETVTRFRDGSGRFFLTPAKGERLLVRPRETGDGAIPSGNSVVLMNALRLGRMTGGDDYAKQADALLRTTAEEVDLAPSTSAHFLSAAMFALGPSLEIVLAGDDVRAMQREVFAQFVPNKVVLHRPAGAKPGIVAIAPFTAEQKPREGRATAYVCTNFLCRMPVTELSALREALRGGRN